MTPRALLDALFAAWQAHDAWRAGACFCEDAEYREADGRNVPGREAICDHFAHFFAKAPLWRFEVDAVIVEGETAAVAYRFALEGTDGTYRERNGCALVGFDQGSIIRWREYHAGEIRDVAR